MSPVNNFDELFECFNGWFNLFDPFLSGKLTFFVSLCNCFVHWLHQFSEFVLLSHIEQKCCSGRFNHTSKVSCLLNAAHFDIQSHTQRLLHGVIGPESMLADNNSRSGYFGLHISRSLR